MIRKLASGGYRLHSPPVRTHSQYTALTVQRPVSSG